MTSQEQLKKRRNDEEDL